MESKLVMSLRWAEDIRKALCFLEAVEGGMIAHPSFPQASYERKTLLEMNNAIYNLQLALKGLEAVSASFGISNQTQIDLQPYPPYDSGAQSVK